MKQKILNLTKKNRIVLLYLTILIFLLSTLLSFAYLNTIKDDITKTTITGTGSSTVAMNFTTTGSVDIELNSDTFGLEATNYVNSITSTVTSYPLDNSVEEVYYYNVFLVLENTFVYSSGTTPEILINIYDDENNEITSISGLSYTTVGDISGFDITETNGTVLLVENKEISALVETSESWYFTITLIAAEYDQSINEGAVFNASITMLRYTN